MDGNAGHAGSTDACQSQFDTSHAVIIGIGDYGGGIPALATPENDATRLAELLEREHGYKVRLLVAGVTRDRLVSLFRDELPGKLGQNDRLLVFFAGHGIACDGEDGPQGYLVPQDARPDDPASLLPMAELHGWLSALPCRHMLAVFDCCFAGAFRWSSTRYIGEPPKVLHKERFDRFLQSPAWQVITSASDDQRALDLLTGSVVGCLGTRKEDGDQHSPFARAFLAGLAGKADVPKGKGQGDGVITATELALYLRDTVEVEAAQRANLEQTPQIWPLNKHRKGEYIFLVPGHPLNLPPAETLTKDNNPYRGLKPYERKHRALFFGREEETAELLARLELLPFVAVLGASGTGKSSLVKAGLLPRLAEAGPQWCVLPPIRPTDHPLRVLAALLRQNLPDIPVDLKANHGLADAVAAWKAANSGRRLVLTVDQCEELLSLCRDDDERLRFLSLLAQAARSHPDAFRLVITLRTDFEPQLVQASSLARAWTAARYVVPPLDPSDLRAAIEGPASVRVLYFEPEELVDKLITEVLQMPGALPLLSFTLSEMYLSYVRDGRDDRALTEADYEALGGVIGSLRQRATREYDDLPDDAHRATMRRVMLRMISAEGGELARRRVALGELEYPDDDENARAQAVLERLVDARLLVRDMGQNEDGTEQAYVEPAHDALVLAWDKLLQWKLEAESDLLLQRQVARDALQWAEKGQEAGLLWDDDPRLPLLERAVAPAAKGAKPGALARARQALWPDTSAARYRDWLNKRELDFARESMKRRASGLRKGIGITAAVFVVLAGLTVMALLQRGLALDSEATAIAEANSRATEVVVRTTAQAAEAQARQVAQTREAEAQAAGMAEAQARAEAEAEARRSRSGELAAQAATVLEANPELALLLARKAVETTYLVDGTALPRASAILQRALASPFRQVFQDSRAQAYTYIAPIVAPDGSSFLGSAGGWRLYDTRNWQAIGDLQGHRPCYSPDSRSIATVEGTPDHPQGEIIRLYGAADGALQSEFVVALPWVESLAFSPDGQYLLAAGCTGAGEGCEAGQVQVLAPDGRLHVSSSTAGTGSPQAAFNPADGRRIAVVEDGAVFLWDIETGEKRWLVRDAVPVVSAAFSGYGERVSTLTADGAIHLWDRDGNYLKTLTVPGPSPAAVVLNRDGTRILSGAYSDTDNVTLQDAAGQVLATKTGMLYDIHPFEPRFATAEGFGSGEVSVWDEAGNLVARFTAHRGRVDSLKYSPDGRHLATSGCDVQVLMGEVCQAPTTRFWAFDDRLTLDTANNGAEILALYPAPDGAHLLALECAKPWGSLGCLSSATGQRLGAVWDLATGQAVALGGAGEYAAAARFTAAGDGVLVLVCDPFTYAGCDTPRLMTYNLDGQPTGPVTGPYPATVAAADIAPDGRRVLLLEAGPGSESSVSSDASLALSLWDVMADGWIPAGSAAGTLAWAAFSPDGGHVAAVDVDRDEMQLWDLDGRLVMTAALGADVQATDDIALWGRFSPDGRRLVLSACTAGHMGSCDDHTVFLWSPESGQVHSLQAGTGLISSLEFSADGKWLAIVNPGDRLVQLWDTSGAGVERLRASLTGFTTTPVTAAFWPPGWVLLTGHADGTVWLWDTEGNPLGPTKAFTNKLTLATFSGDGQQVVAVGCDAVSETGACEPQRIRAWPVRQGLSYMLAEANSRLGGRRWTAEECQSYLGLETCP